MSRRQSQRAGDRGCNSSAASGTRRRSALRMRTLHRRNGRAGPEARHDGAAVGWMALLSTRRHPAQQRAGGSWSARRARVPVEVVVGLERNGLFPLHRVNDPVEPGGAVAQGVAAEPGCPFAGRSRQGPRSNCTELLPGCVTGAPCARSCLDSKGVRLRVLCHTFLSAV